MRAAKVDKNQMEIVTAFRQFGASVHILSTVGDGFPDLAIGFKGKTYLVEVKTDSGKLTPDQITWHKHWHGHAVIIRNISEVIGFINAVQLGE